MSLSEKRVFLTIGASNDDLEAVAPLAGVSCFLGRDWSAPERALEVGSAGRIGAIGRVSVQARVALDVHVERFAARGLVAF